MATSVTFDGVTFTDTDLAGSGYLTPVSVGGTSYPRWQALFVAARNELNNLAASAGGGGFGARFIWDTGTTDADPGAGKIRGSSATQTAIATLYVDVANAGGTDVSAMLDALDDSTSSVDGTITLRKSTNADVWLQFSMTGLTSAAGYRKLTVTYVAGPGGFGSGDVVLFSFARTGDKGDIGTSGWGATRTRAAKTANYTITTGDAGKLIDCTSGSFAVTLPSAGTAGDGFAVGVRNSGTGTITVQTAAVSPSEFIDRHHESFLLGPNEHVELLADGAGWLRWGRSTTSDELFPLAGWVLPHGVKVAGVDLTTDDTRSLLPAVGSGEKTVVLDIHVANIDGASSADATFGWFDNSASATRKLAHTVAVAADVAKGMGAGRPIVVLEQNDQLRGGASANGDLQALIFYTVVSSSSGWLSVGAALGTTLTTEIVSATPTAKARDVFNIQAANTHGTTACDVTVDQHDSSAATAYMLGSTISVAADEAKGLLVGSPGTVLEEGDKIRGGRGASGTADIVVTYFERDVA